jgi:hypothetical protein
MRKRSPCLSAAEFLLAGLAALLPVSPAVAQYSFDPNNADEKGPGTKYFGSAKDDRGALLPGVMIVVAGYTAVITDPQGRYRANLADMNPDYDQTLVWCSKPGYTFVRVIKRMGPAGGIKKTVEADCILRKNN